MRFTAPRGVGTSNIEQSAILTLQERQRQADAMLVATAQAASASGHRNGDGGGGRGKEVLQIERAVSSVTKLVAQQHEQDQHQKQTQLSGSEQVLERGSASDQVLAADLSHARRCADQSSRLFAW